MRNYLYCVIHEEFKGKNIIKFGRTCNPKSRFRDYGELDVIKISEVKDVVRMERELHQIARIYFGKAIYRKEYYKCENLDKAMEVFDEIVSCTKMIFHFLEN
jgi:hypothetical protein